MANNSSLRQKALMVRWFGDTGTIKPIRLMNLRGWTLGDDFIWDPPTKAHTVHLIEYEIIMFLMDEWDFGGIRVGSIET